MASTLAADAVRAEQRSLTGLVDRPPRGDYLGAAAVLVDAPLARAAAVLADPSPEENP